MKYKNYPNEFWQILESTLKKAKQENTNLHAVFDADGTLWDTDLGENLFHYTIDKQLVPLPEEPWNYYSNLKLKNNDPRDAYLWLAQIYKGVPLATLRAWSQAAFDSHQPMPIFPEQIKLINLLQEYHVDIRIVTASITWAVEPGAKALGLPNSSVIGVETKILNEAITDIAEGIITYRQGKVDAYKHRVGAVPFLAAGNSEGDIELLEFASQLRIAVSAANREDKLYKSELKLQSTAAEKGWIVHRFI